MIFRILILVLYFFFVPILTYCNNSKLVTKTRLASLSVKNSSNEIRGTGFVIKGNLIITNYHVIEPILEESSSIFVSEFDSESKIKVNVKYYDEYHDIAVLETYAEFSNYLLFAKNKLEVGTEVYACGNGRGGAAGAFTTGAVSGYKTFDDGVQFIQHTAPIAPGNSGGPLVNKKGLLVGVNSRTALSLVKDVWSGDAEAVVHNTTMGFALPSNTLKGILETQGLYDNSFNFQEFINSYKILMLLVLILISSYIAYLIMQKNNTDKGNRKNKIFKPKNLYGNVK